MKSDSFVKGLSIICAIIGTVLFVVYVSGDWYADFDLNPTGLITGILTVVLYLLPVAISLLIGGGCGLLFGGLLGIIIVILGKHISSSFLLLINGLKNRIKVRKKSAEIRKNFRNASELINRLQELRKLGLKRTLINRTNNLCQLLVAVSNEEQMKECLEAVNSKMAIVAEINEIEQNIVQLADKYKTAGNAEKSIYYLKVVESGQNKTNFDEIKKSCNEQLSLREKESKAIKLWVSLTGLVLSALIIIFTVSYFIDAPYRELRTMIENQTLTSEMFDSDHRNDEGSYYEYLHSDSGYKFLATELTKLHKNDDIEKAMWLLCVQPDCINGINVCASDSFIDWVVNYGKENDSIKTFSDDTIYTVDGYEITISSIFDSSIGHTFIIDNGQNKVSVENKNPYWEGAVPTIQ